jgi:hypothetical protein
MFLTQMNKLIDKFYELKNNIVVFMLSLLLLFGIASEAFAEPSSEACPAAAPCRPNCIYSAAAGRCVPRIILRPPADDLVPTDTLNSTNSNPLAPSSSGVAPPIGNPTP